MKLIIFQDLLLPAGHVRTLRAALGSRRLTAVHGNGKDLPWLTRSGIAETRGNQ